MHPKSITVLFITSDSVLAAIYRLKPEFEEYSFNWTEPRYALDVIRSALPDLIYLDLDSIEGPEVLQRIKASVDLRSRPPIVITRRPEQVNSIIPGRSDSAHVISSARPLGSVVSA